MKEKASKLNEKERVVPLIFDEIFIHQHADYFAGKMCGLTEDNQLASTVLAFMIHSLSSKYQEIIRLVPVSMISAEKIHQHFSARISMFLQASSNYILFIIQLQSIKRTEYYLYSFLS